MKCPCHECLVFAACKNKKYNILVSECDEVRLFLNYGYVGNGSRALHRKRARQLEKVLDSNVWRLGVESANGYHLRKNRKWRRNV